MGLGGMREAKITSDLIVSPIRRLQQSQICAQCRMLCMVILISGRATSWRQNARSAEAMPGLRGAEPEGQPSSIIWRKDRMASESSIFPCFLNLQDTSAKRADSTSSDKVPCLSNMRA